MSMTHTTIEAARDRAHWDTDKERQHGPSNNVVTVWDFDGGQSLELTAGELEEYEQAEGVLLDEDVIGPERFANLLAWLRDEELLEQPIHGSPVTDEEMAQENARLLAQHTPGPFSISGIAGDNYVMARGQNHDRVIVAIVPGWVGIKPEEHAANMALFRAAPELLLACRALEQAVDLWFNEGSRASGVLRDLRKTLVDDAMMQTRAAIAKATGGAQ